MSFSFSRPLAFLAALFLAGAATAAPKMSGSYRYTFDGTGRNVTIGIDKIANTSAQNATANLMVKLWALDAPYNGGTLTGHLLASFPLSGLAGGRQYTGISKTVAYHPPPVSRAYYLCITIGEYSNGNFGIVDWGNLPNTKVLGPVKLFTLEGPWSWKSSYPGGTVDLSFAKFTHARTGSTGSLRFELWASPAHWNGGPMPGGRRIAVVEKPALAAGNMYSNVQNTAKFEPPPDGHYYVSLVVYEFDQTYKVVAFLPGNNPVPFQRP